MIRNRGKGLKATQFLYRHSLVALLTSRCVFKKFPEGKLSWLADKPTLTPPNNGLVVLDSVQEGSPANFTMFLNDCGTD